MSLFPLRIVRREIQPEMERGMLRERKSSKSRRACRGCSWKTWVCFVTLSIVFMTFVGTSRAQVETWVVGGDGLSWDTQASQKEVPVAVDVSDASMLRVVELSPEGNICGTVQWEYVNRWSSAFLGTGKAYISDNVALKSSSAGLAMVDGDSTTSTGDRFKGYGQTGVTFYFDLGAAYPLNRIRFYTSPSGRADYFPRACEVSISDGETFGNQGDAIYEFLTHTGPEPVVDIRFSSRLIRFVRLRILSPDPFEIAEFEAYGEGVVPHASYLSKFIAFDPPVNFGDLTLHATKLAGAPDDEAFVLLKIRNGADETPLIYYRKDIETGEETEVSEEEYVALEKPQEKGTILYDTEHWSPWSNPIQIDITGELHLPLAFLPGPRAYLQFMLFFESSSTGTIRIDRLSVQYSSALATLALGEIALLGQADPPDGAAVTPSGVSALFTYDVRAHFDTQTLSGFDGIKIETPMQSDPASITLEMGEPLSAVNPDSVRVGPTFLSVYFPSHRVTTNEPLRITFETTPVQYTTMFNGWLLDTGGNLSQPILAGNVWDDVRTNSLAVFGSSTEPSLSLDIAPELITPNGDGFNDEALISYGVTQLAKEDIAVRLRIYDLSGAMVKEVFSGRLAPGIYDATWDGRNGDGELLSPGLYLCQISAETEAKTLTKFERLAVVY